MEGRIKKKPVYGKSAGKKKNPSYRTRRHSYPEGIQEGTGDVGQKTKRLG